MTDDKEKGLSLSEERDERLPEMAEDASVAAPLRAGNPRPDSNDDTDDEDDDETWTNRPEKEGSEPTSEELEHDDVSDEDEEVEQARATRRSIQNGRDVLCEELPERAQRAALRLKPFLTGVLVIEFPDSGERFVFDWRDDTPKTHAISRDVAVLVDQPSGPSVEPTKVSADALIMIADKHVMAVRSGDLNPQVGMLTDKIRVKGKVASAVYLFNLIAPRVRS